MSTEIITLGHEPIIRLDGNGGTTSQSPYAQITAGDEVAYTFNRAAFLAAVAAECGVIIIDRDDLPEVTEQNGQHYAGGAHRSFGDAAQYRQYALGALAIAEYLDANPPVDEADVEALARDLAVAAGYESDAVDRNIARRLVAAGWKR